MSDKYIVIYKARSIAEGDFAEEPDSKLLAAVADVPADAEVVTLVHDRKAAIAFAQKARGAVYQLGRLVYRNSEDAPEIKEKGA
jgi:hypothetical protein